MLRLCTVIALVSPALAGQQLLENGSFEGAFAPRGIAEVWADNSSWADLDVTYAADREQPRSGKACLRIDCTRLASGAVQVTPVQRTPLTPGRVYRVSGWVRAESPQAVALQLRLTPTPYTVYVQQFADAADEWTRVEYLWTSPVDDPKGLFMVRFTKQGTVWLDDLSVEALDADELKALPPPSRGNLLLNGSFDLDLAGWLWGHGCDYWQEADVRVEESADGQRYFRLDVPEGTGVFVNSAAVPVAPGHAVHSAARLRADPPASVRFGIKGATAVVEAGPEWQEVSRSADGAFAPVLVSYISLSVQGPATIYLDDVRLWQDGDEEIPARAAVLPDRFPLALYHDGEAPRLRLMAAGQDPPAITWRVVDFWDREVAGGTWMPENERDERVEVIDPGRGWFRAEVTWTTEGEEHAHESTLAVLPPGERRGPIENDFFGAHFALDPTGIRLAKALGVRWLRLHPPNHTKWRVLQPTEDTWNWRDEPIRIARDEGFALIGSLDRLPTWASRAPADFPDHAFYTGTGAFMPRDWGEWENYVERTVTRHKDQISIWEIWNEPNLQDWLRPPEGQTRAEAYVDLLRHTTPIVKRVQPDATVIGGVIAGPPAPGSPAGNFATEMIELGGLELMDVLSFHEYIVGPIDEGEHSVAEWTEQLRRTMRAAGRELPIMNSEGGFATPGTSLAHRLWDSGTVPSREMAPLLVRQHVAQWAAGVESFFFYNFFINGFATTRRWEGMLENEGQPRPNVAAYATLSWLLDGARFEETTQPSDDCWVHRFSTPRGPLSIAWSRTGTTAECRVPDANAVWDIMGAAQPVPLDGVFRLTEMPIYVLSPET